MTDGKIGDKIGDVYLRTEKSRWVRLLAAG
jgi:hypothetical protein